MESSHILTMDNLRNTCRSCFNAGEIDLFEHKVIIDGLNDGSEDGSEYESYEVDAIDLWKIYQDVDLLNLTMELKLICHMCLEELINCYKFYIKISRISERKRSLFEEAQRLQSEQLDNLIVEVFKNEDTSETDGSHIDHECDFKTTLPSNIEMDTISQSNSMTETEAALNQTENDFSAQTPSSIDINEIVQYAADGDEKEVLNTEVLENDSNNLIDYETISHVKSIIYEPNQESDYHKDEAKSQPQKRPRLKFIREKLAGYTGPVQPPHHDAALVVTQFLPVKTKKKLKTDSLENEFNDDFANNLIESTQDLSTVEYTAVEIKSSNFQHLDNGELEFENDVNLCDDDSKPQTYFCQYCPNAFSAAAYLIAHIRKSHVCKYCTKAFVKSLDLYVHIRQAHYQHKCAICQKELSSQSNLRGHIKRVHGIRLPAQVALLDYKQPNRESPINF